MSMQVERSGVAHERLSALADGALSEGDVERACADFRDDPHTRATWHCYHLIGDVLRSDDLASHADADARFLALLRGRLATEPVVLAPSAHAQEPELRAGTRLRLRRRTWMASSAVAAGFVVVAGVLVATRPGAPVDGAAPVVAQGGAATVIAASAARPAEARNEPQAIVVDSAVVRDARLDRYLSAHKQFAGGSVIGMPTGFVRNAMVETPGH